MSIRLDEYNLEISQQWSPKNLPLTPSDITYGSSKKVWWIGECGHEWKASIKNRVINKTGCPYCSNNKVLVGFNDLAHKAPDIAREWNYEKNKPLLPTQVAVLSNKKVWWKCKDCKREWETHISTRTGGSKCPYCSGQILVKGFNDFQTKYPKIAKEWSEKNKDLKPNMINDKSRKNVWWKCSTCKNEYKAVINSRVKGVGCPVCAEREVLKGYNDLKTTDENILNQWDYEKNKIKPTDVSRKSLKIVWWKCSLGHSYRQKIAEKTIEGKECPVCEEEFINSLLELAVMYYAQQNQRNILIEDDSAVGIPLSTYIPSERLAIEYEPKNEKIKQIKRYITKTNKITYITLSEKLKGNPIEIVKALKQSFRKVHIFIKSDEEKDYKKIRKSFFEWRNRGVENEK